MPTRTRRIAGCDLGKASAKFVVVETLGPGKPVVVQSKIVNHDGEPLKAFLTWYRSSEIHNCDSLCATGLYATDLMKPAIILPEDICLEAALNNWSDLQGPLNLVTISARGYSVLSRNAHGKVTTLGNEKCSSGTGETMVKIASRFGLSIEEADRLAASAADSIPITARCSVFAKSEMTHFGNQGKAADALFRGYFESIARYVAAMLRRILVPGPIYLLGGVGRLHTIAEILGQTLELPVEVPEQALLYEAIGAACLGAKRQDKNRIALPEEADQLLAVRRNRFETLEAPSKYADRVTRLRPPDNVPPADQPAILGLDLGSTGSKAVLTNIQTGDLVWDAYDRTRGNPIEAATRLIEKLLREIDADVRAIGLTGSGREAVATVVRACFPGEPERIVVLNEIVAHATAAIRCDEHDGQNLSVVEIGGQDAKFIQVVAGQIVESDMNKACSAGTGSFLEEQALFYGVDRIETFTEMAQQSQNPPNLGQMCTVFVTESAAEAQKDGAGVSDLFGGFQYSVVFNYINRVMGSRKFGERIFFQGKPATGPALAWTLAAATGREVIVPPNPGAMGAWGIGLSVIQSLGTARLLDFVPLDPGRVLKAQIVGRSDIRCRDSRCGTLCHIDQTTVLVNKKKQKVFSGGACPKFEISSVGKAKLPKGAPSAFDMREQLYANYIEARQGQRVIGVPHVGALHQFTPWLYTFLKELGLGVRVLTSDGQSLSAGEERCYSYDACAPVKVAHSICDADVDLLLFPKILNYLDADGPGGGTCPMEQASPEMVENALRSRGRDLRILRPILSFADGLESWSVVSALCSLSDELGVSSSAIVEAVHKAARAQRKVWSELRKIGRETLDYATEHDIPVVVVCGPLHVINDRAINAGIPSILKQNGVLALPMDCLLLDPSIPTMSRLVWGDASRAMRVAYAARTHGRVYPLLLSTFGCGPASFVEHAFSALMAGYPHTVLESDGHGGAAGYVTRIQAFLHTVGKHDGLPSPPDAEVLALMEQPAQPSINDEKSSKLVFFSVSDRVSPLLAAFYRSQGFDAVASGPAGPTALAYGRRDCSGKECLAYQLIWGSFREYLEKNPPEKRTVLCQVQGQGMCRNCMFSLKDKLCLKEHGLDEVVDVRHVQPEPEFGLRFVTRYWAGGVVLDLLFQFACFYRPLEPKPGEVDRLYNLFCDQLLQLMATPDSRGLGGMLNQAEFHLKLDRLLQRAAASFASLAGSNGSKQHPDRTVLVTGDIYLRMDAFAADDLIRKLNERGLAVLVEPMCLLGEYLVEERSAELMGLPTGLFENRIARAFMLRIRERHYRTARRWHPWLPQPDAAKMIQRSAELIDRHPTGEAPITIGSVLHNWDEKTCDGVVLVSPWGCGPALITESLLRHQSHIPMLFIYNDGSPLNDRRLDGFAFRIQQDPAHRLPAAPATAADRSGVWPAREL